MSCGPRKSRNRSTKASLWRHYHSGQAPCYYCGEMLSMKEATIDHVVPRSKGGGQDDNCVIACARCNQLKDDLDLEEFLELLEREMCNGRPPEVAHL